jgi:uncharacterized glyoxalase superfamily protein PhnB
MKKSIYPVIMCNDLTKEANFFINLFDFQEVFSSEWYISIADDRFELAFIDKNHKTIPQAYRKNCSGMILNIEVDNVDELYSKLSKQENVSFLQELKNETYGQRHFLIESPSGVMIDVIQMISPTEEYLDNYINDGVNHEGK